LKGERLAEKKKGEGLGEKKGQVTPVHKYDIPTEKFRARTTRTRGQGIKEDYERFKKKKPYYLEKGERSRLLAKNGGGVLSSGAP